MKWETVATSHMKRLNHLKIEDGQKICSFEEFTGWVGKHLEVVGMSADVEQVSVGGGAAQVAGRWRMEELKEKETLGAVSRRKNLKQNTLYHWDCPPHTPGPDPDPVCFWHDRCLCFFTLCRFLLSYNIFPEGDNELNLPLFIVRAGNTRSSLLWVLDLW